MEHRMVVTARKGYGSSEKIQHLCGKSGAGSGVWSDRWHDDAWARCSAALTHRRWIFTTATLKSKWK